MVAGRLADIDDLNRRARTLLRDEGYLDADQVVLAGRAFAEGDDVLALHNDYRVGVLNGTRGLIQQIDAERRAMTVTTDDRERLTIPFAYAAAGHLTHGYATTIHKAQGLTVDRCYVLADDAATLEHAYTALSRGRHHNELFVVHDDHRHDERHGPEIEPDSIDRLRRAIGRTVSQHMAIDQTDQPTSRLETLRQERDQLQRHLGDGPPDPGRDHRRLSEERRREQAARDGACGRRDQARRELDRLGPIGRLTRRAARTEVEHRLARFELDIERHEVKLAGLDRRLNELAPAMLTRHDWERAHRPELDRLSTLERHIELEHGFQRVAQRERQRGLEPGHGIEL